MASQLNIADKLSLPREAVTQTFAILAKRGVGKTYTALVMVEEMLKAGLPVVVADPIGVCWGLRASADGKSEGLPIVVLGGEHGDVPLESTAGATIADFIIETGQSAVLDLSLFRKGEQTRFMTDFAERLYHKNRNPLHLLLDEADAFAPQRPMRGQERMLGAVEDLVRRGRARGIGLTLVTQRAAVLNKDVLTQVEVMVALRTISPQDRAAMEAWINVHGSPEQQREMMNSLPSLPIGEAWFWSPGWLDIFQRVKVRARETFDSSATPKVGQKVESPKRLAEVNLVELRERIAATIEKAKENDPAELKRQIAELKKQLAGKGADPATVERAVATAVAERDREWQKRQAELERQLEDVRGRVEKIAALAQLNGHAPPAVATVAPARIASRPTAPARVHAVTPPPAGGPLSKAERKILAALAQYPQGRTKRQVAVLTVYAHTGGGFNNALSSLRTKGFIEGASDLRITERGVEALGEYEPLPTGAALLDFWRGQLSHAEREILNALAEAHPRTLTKQEVAARTRSNSGEPYTPEGGGFNNALSKLRTLELVEGRGELKASDDLFG